MLAPRVQVNPAKVSVIQASRFRNFPPRVALSPYMRSSRPIPKNIWLFLILSAPAFLTGHPGGLAWEAHLGGFLAGLFLGPLFLAKSSTAERPLAEA